MKIELTKDKLVIKFSLREMFIALKRKLEIPISTITDIKPYKEAGIGYPIRLVGTSLGHIKYGIFATPQGSAFIATRNINNATVLFLQDFGYKLAILDLDEKTVQELENRISSKK